MTISDTNIHENAKSKLSFADYAAIERLIRERPSLATLEKAVQLFPTCVIFWITYLEFLVENQEKAFKVAERAICHCPHIDLWRRYLNLGKSLYRLPDYFHIYEKAVAAIGNDYQSVDFWIEYTYLLRAIFNIQTLSQFGIDDAAKLPPNAFLLPLSTVLPAGITEDTLDVDSLTNVKDRPSIATIRDVFQTGLSVPMERIDSLWDEYQAFEQVVASAMNSMAQSIPVFPGMPPPPAALASIQATKMLSEYSNRWIQSKQGLREINRLYSAVNLYFAPIPLDPSTATTLQTNILKWREIVKHEKSNPLKLNFKKFASRMDFVLKQCLMVNVYVSEFWYEMFIWNLSSRGFDDGIDVLRTAVDEFLSRDVTLRIVLSLVYEEMGRISDTSKFINDSLKYLEQIGISAPSLLMHYIRFCVRCQGARQGRSVFLDVLREKSIHLSPEVVLAFAKLEVSTLHNPIGALRVLDLLTDSVDGVDTVILKEVQDLKLQIASSLNDVGERLSRDRCTILDMSHTDAHSIIQEGFMASLRDDINEKGDLVELDNVEEDEKDAGGVRRPELTRMQSFKPGMDYDEGSTDQGKGRNAVKVSLPSSLRALVTVLPSCEGHVPETDTVLRALQMMTLPGIAIASLKRFEEDIHIESLRREKEAGGAPVTNDGDSLKRLIGEEKNDNILIKADLLDDEKDQREFLSALAANVHRDRVNYKRHKLSLINAAAIASLGKSRIAI